MGESRKFMLVVVLSFSLVLIGIFIANLAFTIDTINDNQDASISQYKEVVQKEAEKNLYDFAIMLRNPDIRALLFQGSEGDDRKLAVSIFNMLKASLGEPYYLCLVKGEKVVVSKLPGETGKSVPEDLVGEGSVFTGDFRGKAGELLMLAAPVSEDFKAVVVMDKTEDIQEGLRLFEDQKSRVKRASLLLFLVFLAVAILAAVFAIGWANSRYISGPIRKLEDQAKALMDGDVSTSIEPREGSDYYALQALLDSMQKLLREASFKESAHKFDSEP